MARYSINNNYSVLDDLHSLNILLRIRPTTSIFKVTVIKY